MHRPALLRMPAFLLHALAGDLADELLLGGRRVLPDKAQASGFKFRHETLPSALSAILGGEPRPPSSAASWLREKCRRSFTPAVSAILADWKRLTVARKSCR